MTHKIHKKQTNTFLCVLSAETLGKTSEKTSEGTMRCSVFMNFYGLISEISRVITKTQLDVYTLDVLFLQTHLGSCFDCFVCLFPRS